ncbi:unnamed protein product, partial [Didymodactylos carnosus]
MATRVTSKKP